MHVFPANGHTQIRPGTPTATTYANGSDATTERILVLDHATNEVVRLGERLASIAILLKEIADGAFGIQPEKAAAETQNVRPYGSRSEGLSAKIADVHDLTNYLGQQADRFRAL